MKTTEDKLLEVLEPAIDVSWNFETGTTKAKESYETLIEMRDKIDHILWEIKEDHNLRTMDEMCKQWRDSAQRILDLR